MRVKIGNFWCQVQPGCPIMVDLTDKDKSAIANMPEGVNLYAEFPEDGLTFVTPEEKYKWMTEGFPNSKDHFTETLFQQVVFDDKEKGPLEE